MNRRSIALLAAVLTLVTMRARADDSAASPAGDAERLAKQLSNPVADLVSIPFQFNWEEGVGEQDATRFVLNVQPVVPFELNDKWNLIGRWIMPFVSQPELAPGLDSTFGLSDILFSAFFAPRSASRFIWAAGPVVSLPTTDDPALGSGKWQAGPTVVVLKQNGGWTYGFLANQLWSFASTSDTERRDVNKTFLQPFLSYTTSKGVSLSVQSEATYDRKAADGDKWTAPINVSVSKVTRFGPFPFSVQGGFGYFVEAPSIGPERRLRIAFTLLLPRGG